MGPRTYDLILWGATGFTGKLVAEYLAQREDRHARPLRWAMAGRNMAKLEALRDELAQLNPSAQNIPIVQADSQDLASLKAMAAQTRVICTTVGPYAHYGAPLVEACVAEGTHYCDITGEVPFIRAMIDAHHETAQQKRLRIVHCCGFDSIPSDLGCLMMQDAMHKKYGVYADEVRYYAGPSKGGFSGGTVVSLANVLVESKKKEVRRILGNPYSLNPPHSPKGLDVSDQMGIRWDSEIQRWTAPFVMAAINTRMVRRSHALLGYPYGEQFRYSEVMCTPKGWRGWFMATSITLGLGSFATLMAFSPTRKLLQATMLPAPGDGPSKQDRDTGYFNTYLMAKSGSHRLYGLVHASKDPGYAGTAIMLSESAICLALDAETLPQHFGVITPATAMGHILIERLRQAGMVFQTSDTFQTKPTATDSSLS